MVPAPLESALYGAFGAYILFHSDRLGVFGVLCDAEEPLTSGELARRLKTDPIATDRLLSAASSIELLQRVDGRFLVPAKLRSFVDPNSESYIGPLLSLFRDNTTPLLAHLDDAVRTGRAQWHRHANGSTQSPFDALYSDSEKARQFLKAMWRLGYPPATELAAAPFLAEHTRLVDVGGATGSFAHAVVQRHRTLSATVFDLPAVKPHFDEAAESFGFADKIDFRAGDFWNDPLPPADLYSLGYILSDLDDERAVALLTRLGDALPPGGKALVLERLLDENRTTPRAAVMQDIAMMLETGGRHRTANEYEELLRRSGLRDCRVFRSSGEKHLIYGVKPH